MKDLIEVIKILTSKKFWSDFKEYYSPSNIAIRMQKYTKGKNAKN